MAREFLTTREVERLVRLNRVTIYRLIREGQFPAIKVGSQWRFERAAVEQWLTNQQSSPSTEVRESFVKNELTECATGASYLRTPVYMAEHLVGYTVMGPLVRDAYHMEVMRQRLPEVATHLGVAPEVLLRHLSAVQTLNTSQLEVPHNLLTTVISTVLQSSVERRRTENRLKTIARLAAGEG